MTPELTKAIHQSQELHITTYGADGEPGTVPVWFDYYQGRFYISTMPDTLKCKKIRLNPRVKLAIGGRRGPAVVGRARFVSEENILGRIAPLHARKYPSGPWRSVEELVRWWREGKERVLLEISTEGGTN